MINLKVSNTTVQAQLSKDMDDEQLMQESILLAISASEIVKDKLGDDYFEIFAKHMTKFLNGEEHIQTTTKTITQQGNGLSM